MADEAKKTGADLGPNSDYLIRGSDYLANHPDFELVGRDTELKEVANVLMRKDANNIILTGQPGVGVSAGWAGVSGCGVGALSSARAVAPEMPPASASSMACAASSTS